jgi:hypothetical protein
MCFLPLLERYLAFEIIDIFLLAFEGKERNFPEVQRKFIFVNVFQRIENLE